MKRHLVIAVSLALLFTTEQVVGAQINATVIMSVSPDVFNGITPANSFYGQNALYSLAGGASNPLIGMIAPQANMMGGPAAYTPGNLSTYGLFSSSPSPNTWNGQFAPTGAFATQTGNNFAAGLAVTASAGNSFQVSPAGLVATFTANGLNPNDISGTMVHVGAGGMFTNTIVGVDTSNGIHTSGAFAGVTLKALYAVGAVIAEDSSGVANQAALSALINGYNGGQSFSVSASYSGFVNNTAPITQTPQAFNVPEPTSLVVLGLGMVGLLGYVYRRRQSAFVVA